MQKINEAASKFSGPNTKEGESKKIEEKKLGNENDYPIFTLDQSEDALLEAGIPEKYILLCNIYYYKFLLVNFVTSYFSLFQKSFN